MTKNIEALTREYLTYCKNQKRLDEKTLKQGAAFIYWQPRRASYSSGI